MKIRRYLCILLVLAMTLALVPAALAASPFEDVREGDFFYDAVMWAFSRGFTTGTTPSTYSPEEICTRAQVVTFLWRVKGRPEPEAISGSFTDVEAGSFYERAVYWSLEQGIVNGTTDTTFSPDDPCTYAHIITLLWRANGRPETGGSSWLTADWPESWYKDAVTWAENSALFEGEDEQFDPDALCSRARIVVWLHRDAVVYASDVMRLMEAVSSGREIYLSPGTYDLSEWIEYLMEGQPWDTGNPAVTLTQVNDGWEVLIRDVQSLTIAAQPGAEEAVVFTVEPRYANVLSFLNCDGLTLSGLTMGHTAEQGTCQGAVLNFNGCGVVSLNALDLYGCGTYGITAEDVGSLSTDRLLIRDCSYGAMTLSGVWYAAFNGCVFQDCGELMTLEIMSSTVTFSDSVFSNNAGEREGSFLYTDESSQVHFLGCMMDEASREAITGHALYGKNVFLA